ncbi:hypothetical protein [Romboutsia maritimum]|uniref:hypothetical protein n=1 Tax=Romboutsia maritimum TaxID=2020948 RepID=UPI002E8E514B|nr:hypothetical protein [Romboutsia maritimum]
MKKVLKIIIMSSMICFFVTFALIIINAIMGVLVSLDYYFMMASSSTIGLSIGLILFNSRRIFSKKLAKKLSKKVVASKKVVRPNKQQTTSVRKRKIS